MDSNNFGLESIDAEDIAKLTFIPKNLLSTIESHRGLKQFDSSKPEQYYLYTGRGPSLGSLHIGHLLGLNFILEFRKYIKGKIYFMIADDEKMLRDKISQSDMDLHVENTLIQLYMAGFESENTYIRINSNGLTEKEYKIVIELMKLVTTHDLHKIFGEKEYIGDHLTVFIQMMPCFIEEDKHCIIIAGIDQDPFFRLARSLAKKMGRPSPIIIYTKNVPGLDGSNKMSTSMPESIPIFIADSEEVIRKKSKFN